VCDDARSEAYRVVLQDQSADHHRNPTEDGEENEGFVVGNGDEGTVLNYQGHDDVGDEHGADHEWQFEVESKRRELVQLGFFLLVSGKVARYDTAFVDSSTHDVLENEPIDFQREEFLSYRF
jgi:hypothetical protein